MCSNSAKKDSFLDGDKESHQGNPIILDTPLATQTGHHQLFPFLTDLIPSPKKLYFYVWMTSRIVFNAIQSNKNIYKGVDFLEFSQRLQQKITFLCKKS